MRMAILMALSSPWSREAVVRLTCAGNDVHVIEPAFNGSSSYLDENDPLQAAEIRHFSTCVTSVHRLSSPISSKLRYIGVLPSLRRILRKIRPDFLLTLYGGWFAAMAYLSSFRPYGVYVVGTDVLFGGFSKRLMSRIALTKAHVVFANGIHLAQRARELAPQANIAPVYLGTDTVRLSPGKPPQEPVRIVCTRGFSEIYNNEYLVRALAEIPPLKPAYEVIFAAPGPLLQQVIALADRILPPEQRGKVSFLGGVNRDGLVRLLKSCHIFVSTSRSDGTSLSLMEGLACGLFPVLSDIPANREWIRPEMGNGFLVPLDDPKALAYKLACAIEDTGMRDKAAGYNRTLIINRADDRKTMEALSSKIHLIVAGYPKRSSSRSHAPAESSQPES